MLHRVRHINLPPVDARFSKRFVQLEASRADEGAPRQILLVAGLLADQDNRRGHGAFAEHGLRCALPEMAGAAIAGEPARDLERRLREGIPGEVEIHLLFL